MAGVPLVAPLSNYTAPVHIDVGGTNYTSCMETLTKFPHSKLTKLFNGNLPITMDPIKQQYFLDRDGKVFRHILNYLRNGELTLPDHFTDTNLLIKEATFFDLKELCDALTATSVVETDSSDEESRHIFCRSEETEILQQSGITITTTRRQNNQGVADESEETKGQSTEVAEGQLDSVLPAVPHEECMEGQLDSVLLAVSHEECIEGQLDSVLPAVPHEKCMEGQLDSVLPAVPHEECMEGQLDSVPPTVPHEKCMEGQLDSVLPAVPHEECMEGQLDSVPPAVPHEEFMEGQLDSVLPAVPDEECMEGQLDSVPPTVPHEEWMECGELICVVTDDAGSVRSLLCSDQQFQVELPDTLPYTKYKLLTGQKQPHLRYSLSIEVPRSTDIFCKTVGIGFPWMAKHLFQKGYRLITSCASDVASYTVGTQKYKGLIYHNFLK